MGDFRNLKEVGQYFNVLSGCGKRPFSHRVFGSPRLLSSVGAPILKGHRQSRFARCYIAAATIGVLSCSMVAAKVQQQMPITASPGQVFQNQAASSGATTCQHVMGGLGAALTNGSQFTSMLRINRSAPDKHMITSKVGMTYSLPDLKGRAVGILVGAPLASGCEGEMIRVAPLNRSCEALATTFPRGSARTQNLSGVSLYDLGEGRGEAMLIDNGAGCVAVTIAGTRPDT
ncbi:hypothetical protein [Sphingomonas yabuuchiae]|uniref:Uncharacterized protein n=2 Tax=Sphingomonas yabuuchiae TaxID=172044 RepID=A0ABR6KEJ9_9SPHN|nr:hypothetical protein [Sphingomonas yabuuchiae]